MNNIRLHITLDTDQETSVAVEEAFLKHAPDARIHTFVKLKVLPQTEHGGLFPLQGVGGETLGQIRSSVITPALQAIGVEVPLREAVTLFFDQENLVFSRP